MVKKYLSEGSLLFITIIWGATFVIIKGALSEITPMLFIAVRFTLAAVLLFPFFFRSVLNSSKETIKDGLILGVIYFLGFATQTIGLQYTTATKSAFITGTFVLFTPIFQLIFEKKIPGKGNLIGILFVILGLIFLSSKGENALDVFSEIGSGFNIGDFFTLICAVFFAMYLVYLDISSKKHDYKPLVFIQISLTGLLGIISALFVSATGMQAEKLIINSSLIFAIIYTSVFATIIASTIQTKFQKVVTPTKAGIILSFEPIFSAIFAFFILTEKISNFAALGCILIFLGLLVAEIFDKLNIFSNEKAS
ncbi:MAG: DMT family transporter [Ignavibacteriaceae bacterium]